MTRSSISFLFLTLISTAFSESRNFDLDSCRVQLSCGSHQSTSGILGPKGEKGEPCTCDEISEIERRLDALSTPGCPQTKFDFPSTGQVTNMIRLKVPVPRITEFTVCTRLALHSAGSGPRAILSYATTTADNAFLLEHTNTGIGIWINGVQKIVTIDLTAETHLCVVAAPTQGWFKTYKNGNLFARTPHPGRAAIEGGGSLLIGQEQDAFMDRLDRNQAFSGTLENLMLWYRVLEANDVTELYRNRCSCPERHEVAFTPDQIQIAGKVASIPVNQC